MLNGGSMQGFASRGGVLSSHCTITAFKKKGKHPKGNAIGPLHTKWEP